MQQCRKHNPQYKKQNINLTNKTKIMQTITNTIVFFHTGRGGRFNNAGHRKFCGVKNIEEVLRLNDESSRNSFLSKENFGDVLRKIEGKENLVELFEKCDEKDDFTEFEKRTGLNLGANVYVDSNGNEIISEDELNTGVGTLNWDGEYDTDSCIFLKDCTEKDLRLIAASNEWDKEGVLQEYFNEFTDLKVDWNLFDTERYSDLIESFFNFPEFGITDLYLKTN